MSDPVIAACIVASATIFTSLLQLRIAALREAASRAQQSGGGGSSSGGSRRSNKTRPPVLFWLGLLVVAGAGGFAFSQWLYEDERAAHLTLERELRAHIGELSRTASKLELTQIGTRAEIETEVLRRIGEEGVVVMATVPPCKAPVVPATATPQESGSDDPDAAGEPATATAPPGCTEADASPITLCATIPATAIVTDVELYVRDAGVDAPWEASRMVPGQAVNQARFEEPPEEVVNIPVAAARRSLCRSFAHWSTEQARVARMVVRYSIGPRATKSGSLGT